jgi:1,4-alpha-glucan branching enzyme/maltooligosyltrehalose trehalohydrolase
MGQEFAAATPFQFFCDFEPALARAVAEGRRAEFARFAQYADAATPENIPDPGDAATFARSHLDWSELSEPEHAAWLEHHRKLLAIRWHEIVPLLSKMVGGTARRRMLGETGFCVEWLCTDETRLTLMANVGDSDIPMDVPPAGRPLYPADAQGGTPLPSWSAHWYLTTPT